jgi:hypothetical protein
MSLPSSQQRILNSIDHSLRIREPRLASMFDMFTRLTAGESRPDWEQLTSAARRKFWTRRIGPGSRPSARRRRSGRRGRLHRVLVFCPLLTVLAVLGLLVGLHANLGPASCRAAASVTAVAAQPEGSSCQKALPVLTAK